MLWNACLQQSQQAKSYIAQKNLKCVTKSVYICDNMKLAFYILCNKFVNTFHSLVFGRRSLLNLRLYRYDILLYLLTVGIYTHSHHKHIHICMWNTYLRPFYALAYMPSSSSQICFVNVLLNMLHVCAMVKSVCIFNYPSVAIKCFVLIPGHNYVLYLSL